jgi:cytochrome bd-type quinol oxidase subunit 1
MNEYFEWWYVTIMLVLYIPLFVAAILFFNFFFCKREKESHRKRLVLACWLAIISLVLTMIWTLVYICCLYKYEFVYTGSRPWNEDQYIKQSKKNYAVLTIVIGTVFVLIFLYFLFFIMAINKKYAEYYGDEEDEEEKEPMMKEEGEDKPEEMAAE